MDFPYLGLIRLYFPESEWDHAICIASHECSPSMAGYPGGCEDAVGSVDCGRGNTPGTTYGIFKILDVCYDPAKNPSSPFTADQWSKALDPNINTWMASVIWSHYGWRAWLTCTDCNSCDVPGGFIPFPRGPVSLLSGSLLPTVITGLACGLAVFLGARRRDQR